MQILFLRFGSMACSYVGDCHCVHHRLHSFYEGILPLYEGMEIILRVHLERIANGDKPPMIAVGRFTEVQFAAINEGRAALDLHILEQNEILFMGRHLHRSRSNDGYHVEDILRQILSALSIDALAHINTYVSYTQNPNAREDGYGNQVYDRAVFEMTARKPRAELYSVMPKGDLKKPTKKAAVKQPSCETIPGN